MPESFYNELEREIEKASHREEHLKKVATKILSLAHIEHPDFFIRMSFNETDQELSVYVCPRGYKVLFGARVLLVNRKSTTVAPDTHKFTVSLTHDKDSSASEQIKRYLIDLAKQGRIKKLEGPDIRTG